METQIKHTYEYGTTFILTHEIVDLEHTREMLATAASEMAANLQQAASENYSKTLGDAIQGVNYTIGSTPSGYVSVKTGRELDAGELSFLSDQIRQKTLFQMHEPTLGLLACSTSLDIPEDSGPLPFDDPLEFTEDDLKFVDDLSIAL